MRSSDQPILKPSSPTLQLTILATLLVFTALLLMSIFFKVEVVAKGQGRVVPMARVQVVQPEFDGTITAINVRNGMSVQAGEILIEFDETEVLAERDIIEAELVRLSTEATRIKTLLSGLAPEMIEASGMRNRLLDAFTAASSSSEQYYLEQKALLGAEIDDLLATLDQIAAQKVASDRSEDITRANISRVEAALSIQTERLQVSQDLLDRGTTSRSAFLDAQDAFTQLESEREIYLRELDQKMSQHAALVAERSSTVAALRNRSLQRLTEIEARKADLNQQLTTAQRRLEGVKLSAPVTGVVDKLEVYTVGGVASAGEELLRVVPMDDTFEIEAVFTNTDIGFVETGQRANIKFDAYPAERFGALTGTVADVSADAVEITDGVWGYAVRVEPSANVLVTGNLSNPVRPGMTGEVNITTDNRRLISYFFAPIMKTLESALGER